MTFAASFHTGGHPLFGDPLSAFVLTVMILIGMITVATCVFQILARRRG